MPELILLGVFASLLLLCVIAGISIPVPLALGFGITAVMGFIENIRRAKC